MGRVDTFRVDSYRLDGGGVQEGDRIPIEKLGLGNVIPYGGVKQMSSISFQNRSDILLSKNNIYDCENDIIVAHSKDNKLYFFKLGEDAEVSETFIIPDCFLPNNHAFRMQNCLFVNGVGYFLYEDNVRRIYIKNTLGHARYLGSVNSAEWKDTSYAKIIYYDGKIILVLPKDKDDRLYKVFLDAVNLTEIAKFDTLEKRWGGSFFQKNGYCYTAKVENNVRYLVCCDFKSQNYQLTVRTTELSGNYQYAHTAFSRMIDGHFEEELQGMLHKFVHMGSSYRNLWVTTFRLDPSHLFFISVTTLKFNPRIPDDEQNFLNFVSFGDPERKWTVHRVEHNLFREGRIFEGTRIVPIDMEEGSGNLSEGFISPYKIRDTNIVASKKPLGIAIFYMYYNIIYKITLPLELTLE